MSLLPVRLPAMGPKFRCDAWLEVDQERPARHGEAPAIEEAESAQTKRSVNKEPLHYPSAASHDETELSSIVETLSLHCADLQAVGFHIFDPPKEEPLESIANRFGQPSALGTGRPAVDVLVPTRRGASRPGTLSFIHGTDAFPLHTETAHWRNPVELVLLRCVSPGAGRRPTLLVDGWDLGLGDTAVAQLAQSLMIVKSGARSFLSSLADLGHQRTDLRYDSACMKPATDADRRILEGFEDVLAAARPHTVSWEPGQCLIFDNRRMLHSRAGSPVADRDRRLERIYISEKRP
ncbi:MAG: hypothetical protein F4209_10855 [Chloroflexi bacterium]|nr:hypothetical protein [Chloroflexota bacterium]